MKLESTSRLGQLMVAGTIATAVLSSGCGEILGLRDDYHVVDCVPDDLILAKTPDETKLACDTMVDDANAQCAREDIEPALKIKCFTPSGEVDSTCAAIKDEATLKGLFALGETTCAVGSETN